MDGACRTHGGEEKILVVKPEGTMPLGRRRCRYHDKIKRSLKEIGMRMWDVLRGLSGNSSLFL
jgi:hypothetical protein